MKVSIITVSYNAEKTIEETIKSVLNQSYFDIEYLIIDGGSTDRTVDIIKSYQDKIHRIISEPDNGLYDAMNKGIELATGDIIGILNSDDFYASYDVILKAVQSFLDTDIDAVYGNLYYVDSDDITKVVRKWRAGKYRMSSFLWGWMPPHPTFFVRRNIYSKFGTFNIQFKSAADYEIMLRFIKKYKIKLAYQPEILVKMRSGGISNASIGNRLMANREDKLAWKINGLRPYFFTVWAKPIRKVTQYIFR